MQITTQQNEYLSQIFSEQDLSKQEVSHKEFDSCTFNSCNFSETFFNKCKFIDCTFINCNLSIITIKYSRFLEVIFEGCKMVGIDWTKADWPNFDLPSPIKFYNSIINDSSFFDLSLSEVVIEACKAHCVDFRGCNLSKANFSYTDFSNSQFHETDLRDSDFNEASNYQINIFYNKIKHAKFCRYQAVSLLDSLQIELLD